VALWSWIFPHASCWHVPHTLPASTGSAYKIRYTAIHDLPYPKDEDTETEQDTAAAASVTIVDAHHQPFFRLTAAYGFDRLASLHGETIATAFAGDSVSHQTKSGEYIRLAKEARIQYRRMLGLPDNPAVMPFMMHQAFDQPAHRIFNEDAPWPTV
jgi:hypothetical protein